MSQRLHLLVRYLLINQSVPLLHLPKGNMTPPRQDLGVRVRMKARKVGSVQPLRQMNLTTRYISVILTVFRLTMKRQHLSDPRRRNSRRPSNRKMRSSLHLRAFSLFIRLVLNLTRYVFVLLPLSRESDPDLLMLNPRNRKNPRHLMDQIVVLMSSPAKPEAEAKVRELEGLMFASLMMTKNLIAGYLTMAIR